MFGLSLISTCLLFASLVMLAFWFIQLRTGNAGIVDVVWAFATGVIAIILVLHIDSGVAWRQWLLAVLMLFWSLRLGVYLARRVFSQSEDGRYQYMKNSVGNWAQPVMFVFFQIQALWAVMFALPVWAAAQAPDPAVRVYDKIGLIIFAVAIAGESIADRQLADFRNDSRNCGKVCDTGLWKYSRHPNYFFEWVHWFAYAIIAIGSPYWWVAAAGVVVMYFFLRFVTGVPHTERQSLKSRGDAYRAYQQSTSVFLPLPPKTA